MTRRVVMGCASCRKCSGSKLGNAGRDAAQAATGATAAVLTGGLSLLMKRKCGVCKHPMKFHA
jgi:hypothetical protein